MLDRIRSDADGGAESWIESMRAACDRPKPEAAPDLPDRRLRSGRRRSPTVLDGTYSSDTTADDLRAQGVPEIDVVPGNWGHWVLVVRVAGLR